MRLLGLIAMLLFATPLAGQEAPEPIIETKLEQAEAVPGQAVTLRVQVLVPTWMPSPPAMPGFEAPNLRVRVPPKGSTAISRRVNGETWSGVSRRYLLTPMVPGRITLPSQEVRLNYVGPDGRTPIAAVLHTDEISIAGTVPKGAEGLDPFIAADALTLTQDLSGPTTGLEPGSSVIRKLTATMEGASPIALPQLLAPLELAGLETYPALPQVTEDPAAATISGTRVESQTLMAVGGGENHVPAIRLDWFNLRTGKIETAEVAGFDISVTGPPAPVGASRGTTEWRRILLFVAALLAGAITLWWSVPRLRNFLGHRRAMRLSSERHVRRMLCAAISRRDYLQTSHWLIEWQERRPGVDPRSMDIVSDRMAKIGSTIYRRPAVSDGDGLWRDLKAALAPVLSGNAQPRTDLPEINPHSQFDCNHPA